MNAPLRQNPPDPKRLAADLAADLREAMHTEISCMVWQAQSVLRYLVEGDDTGLVYAYRRMRENDLAAAKTFEDLMALKRRAVADE